MRQRAPDRLPVVPPPMTPRAAAPPPPRRPHLADAIAMQIHSWRPFISSASPTSKKPCLSDRSTHPFSAGAGDIDLSRLSLAEPSSSSALAPSLPLLPREFPFRWFAPRKRRRRGSRSVSGRSSDRSHRRGGCGTCSDFPSIAGAGGTDSSGEMYASWGSDASEFAVARISKRDIGCMEKDGLGSAGVPMAVSVVAEVPGSESDYGSEPGYRGDVELGYGDEVDEEDEDNRQLFWGDRGGMNDMGMVGKDKFGEQKCHHRGRRKKQDWRIPAPL